MEVPHLVVFRDFSARPWPINLLGQNGRKSVLWASAGNTVMSKAARRECDLNNHVRTIEKLFVADNRILNSFPETDVRLSDRNEAVWNVPKGFTSCPVRSMQHQIAYQFG